MMIRIHAVGLVAVLSAVLQVGAAQERPNIVVILADDYGVGSANCYGADLKHIRTPHIDRLAKEGMRFTDASSPASVCSPTRYAFLTGRYAWRGKLQYGVLYPPEGPLLIEPELITLPEYLKQFDYQTAHIGKWHLGYTNMEEVKDLSAQPLEPGPRSLGFDYHFAVPNQIDWRPKIYIENESIWGLRSKGLNPYGKSAYAGAKYHGYDAPQRVTTEVTQDLSDAARNWIFKAVRQNPDQPFFLYFCPVAVHHPISPSEKWRGSSGVGPYGDFIHDLDHSVGEILDALAYSGVLENTVVVFASDNGGDFCPEEQQARNWGFKNNGNVRGDKHMVYEGGVKVPFIVRWPEMIQEGSCSDRMVNVVDLYATFQRLVSGKVLDPKAAAADSFSFYDTLRGAESRQPIRETMVVNDVFGVAAIRMGDWKYIEGKPKKPVDKNRPKNKFRKTRPELYNLKNDPAETEDLINQFPEVAEKMQARLELIRSQGSERIAGGER